MTVFDRSIVLTHKDHRAIAGISEIEWNAAVGRDNPYMDHRHFQILEDSGLVGDGTGFEPYYLELRDEQGRFIAAAPVFEKSHSTGELGVDLGFSLLHPRVAGAYYPKIQIEVPLVPLGTNRLLVAPDADQSFLKSALLKAAKEFSAEKAASSVQISYQSEGDGEAAFANGFSRCETTSFVWQSEGESSLEEYLARLSKNGRYRFRKEYVEPSKNGSDIRVLEGVELPGTVLDTIWELYVSTFVKHGSDPWLNKQYFELLCARMPEHLVFIGLMDGASPRCGFLCFKGEKSLWAQHWFEGGKSSGDLFQLSHSLISYAIDQGLTSVDIGPMGAYKAMRGFTPKVQTHSLYFLSDEMNKVAQKSLDTRCKNNAAELKDLLNLLPYKNKRVHL